jgi:hypothetical protein
LLILILKIISCDKLIKFTRSIPLVFWLFRQFNLSPIRQLLFFLIMSISGKDFNVIMDHTRISNKAALIVPILHSIIQSLVLPDLLEFKVFLLSYHVCTSSSKKISNEVRLIFFFSFDIYLYTVALMCLRLIMIFFLDF